MKCKICGNSKIELTYKGIIRNGGLGKYTRLAIEMYKCGTCGVIWHEPIMEDINDYYESPKYRAVMDEGSDEEVFYSNHDKETFDKFLYTGTDIFRNKTVADIGCGGGSFLDFLKGVAESLIAVEPSEAFRNILEKKGYFTYAYMEDALSNWGGV